MSAVTRERYLAMARTLRQAATDLGVAATARARVLATIREHVGENDG